jgi:hypothetical protein
MQARQAAIAPARPRACPAGSSSLVLRDGAHPRGTPVFIGLGTIVLIVIIVLVILMLRRR